MVECVSELVQEWKDAWTRYGDLSRESIAFLRGYEEREVGGLQHYVSHGEQVSVSRQRL